MFRAAVAFGTAGAIAKGCKRGLCLFNLISEERKVRREAEQEAVCGQKQAHHSVRIFSVHKAQGMCVIIPPEGLGGDG